MSRIEIQKGITLSFEEFVNGASQMDDTHLEKFFHKISTILARRKTPQSEEELQLIHTIYQKLPEKTQERYDCLYGKLQQETISDKEHQELLKLLEIAENHQVRWLKALANLAQLRNVSLEEVREQLGIENYNPNV